MWIMTYAPDPGRYTRITVDVEDCCFFTDETSEEIDHKSTHGLFYFDKPERRITNTVQIIIEKNIDGVLYRFISERMNIDIDTLKILMVFKKACYLVYNKMDPQDYFFEIG
jgi:hypothetical protein